ncbi:UNVERIFIED_CONTAM: hypothetical protein GTU68_061681 [Idotea baltica]|nr:hypothetical protein [Idotea baltica]
MKQHIFITGGSGFIGSRLCALLLKQGHSITVLSRNADALRAKWRDAINVISDLKQLHHYPPPTWVINLAGEPIVDRRWTAQRKTQLCDSRIALTQALFTTLDQLSTYPKVIISGSAVGFYGDTGNYAATEDSLQGNGFAAQLCHDWEHSAHTQAHATARLCLLRTGVVIGADGGMLKKIIWPFKLGLGGKLGNGQQWLSWIALEDICRLIIFLADNETCQGIYNATSPNPVTNTDFTKALGKVLKRPTLLPVPAFVLKTILGEASGLLLDSQRAIPSRALEAGFIFEHDNINACLASAVKK